jgi:hypothetical protein
MLFVATKWHHELRNKQWGAFYRLTIQQIKAPGRNRGASIRRDALLLRAALSALLSALTGLRIRLLILLVRLLLAAALLAAALAALLVLLSALV